MQVNFHIHYITQVGQVLMLSGSAPETGCFSEDSALEMKQNNGYWELPVEIKQPGPLEYHYFIRENGKTVRREWGANHQVQLPEKTNSCTLYDFWQPKSDKAFLYTSAYTDSLLATDYCPDSLEYAPNRVILKVLAPFVRKGQSIGISGDIALFGGWKQDKALEMKSERFPEWSISINANSLPVSSNFKFVILNKMNGKIEHYEWGEPRALIIPHDLEKQMIMHSGMTFRFQEAPWKGAGVAIPIFSLRSENSWGCGDFADLKKMADWAAQTGLQLIQTLPVNDTTLTGSWRDSYPYNAISNYALHPIYASIQELPALKDPDLMKALKTERLELNALPQMDYERVLHLKWNYFKKLFNQEGAVILDSADYKAFFENNSDWLIPYAAFCYLRWKTGKSDFRDWGEYAHYSPKKIQLLCRPDQSWYQELAIHYYIQYLLYLQLTAARDYAHSRSVVLKGDIPIGISRNSVEAWTEPSLFNMDAQVGAPPDDFSATGQNWGFPSYNWDHIQAEDFRWWKRRFEKMSDYFDAYRIDHILGFFRIWEIPLHSVEGLLGHFSPALPLTPEEMSQKGFSFDEHSMTEPFIPENLLISLFGPEAKEVSKTYLKKDQNGFYALKTAFNTQQKIKGHFGEDLTPETTRLRDKLYSLCSEVLFVREPHQDGLFHPRISAFSTERFRWLDEGQKQSFVRLYNDFFYVRNIEFWREKALEKLPPLIGSTKMLACGEDLGMIPSCVPDVMHQLGILSLEIQRMPKTYGSLFENLNNIPYQSVCTTSTHDMNPIRAWWMEDHSRSQQYYQQILWKPGEAPSECTPELATLIVQNHLTSPALWVILPWQDWMSASQKLRHPNPNAERINTPSNPTNYWRYRMHLTLEQLLKEKTFNGTVKDMVKLAGRA
jgi:4-alpha-glucanotransferase